MKSEGLIYYFRAHLNIYVVVVLIMMCLVCGCRRSADPRLVDIDSCMEEHPDSALTLLNSYVIPDNLSDYDRAYYGLLLTHARYKNFIDETNDSLISASADYFMDHGDKEQASRALFLQGMIQKNANRLGEAAVSFRKGLDTAREGHDYMWEGQCARGLGMVYGELLDGSAQVNYAKQSYNAFLKTGDQAWIVYSQLELARALHNNFKYNDSLSLLEKLQDENETFQDSQIPSEIAQLKAVTLFALGKYKESVENFALAYELDHSLLNDNDIRNMRMALYEAYGDSIPERLGWFKDKVKHIDFRDDAFYVLMRKGQYKEAYESLERYKNSQDSILSIIFKNNVSQSITQYDNAREALYKQKTKNERLFYWIIILVVIVVGGIVVWCMGERAHREETKRLKTEADMESLRSDLLYQLDSARMKSGKLSQNTSDEKQTEDYLSIIRKRYADANRLCDEYYQSGGENRKAKEAIDVQINNILSSFREKANLTIIGEYVDEKSGGLYTSFKNDFFDLSDENYRLFLYLVLGFNARSISVIMGHAVSAVYNRKSRLKAKIEKSETTRKDDYLKFF